MKRITGIFATIIISIIIVGGTASAQGQYTAGTVGVDISYPNCSAKVSSNYAYGIVGVNGGLPYSQNPCMAKQAALFENLSFYINTGWNPESPFINTETPRVCTPEDLNCLAYNYGYNTAIFSVNYVMNSGFRTATTWWLDVETMNSWSSDTTQNRNSIQGAYDALNAYGATSVGVYSTTYQWNTISGEWKNMWPSWGATTWRRAKQAATYCTGHEFTGGKSILMQYTGRTLDENVAC